MKNSKFSYLNPEKFFTFLNITTREDKPTLWVFGCSHSYGKGLNPDEKSYGVLLAKMLNMPLKLVAWPGSSTNFSLRHIVNADIRENDIVIWQLTTAERFSYKENNRLFEIILPEHPEKRFVDFFTDEQLHFQQLSLLNIGCMYLRAKKVKFVITSIISDATPAEPLIQAYIKYPEYCSTFDCNVDKGNDNLHVGPLSHQKTSQSIFNHLQLTVK
jgi:hypothetical protein